jgi:hypothetical protein
MANFTGQADYTVKDESRKHESTKEYRINRRLTQTDADVYLDRIDRIYRIR